MVAQNDNKTIVEEHNILIPLKNFIFLTHTLIMGATFVALIMIAMGEGEPPPIFFREMYLLTAASSAVLTLMDILEKKYFLMVLRGFNTVMWTVGYGIWFYGLFMDEIGFVIRFLRPILHVFFQ